MSRLSIFSTLALLPLAVACTAPTGNEFAGGLGGSGFGGSTSTSSTVASSSGDVPLTCDTVYGGEGCCDGSGVLHYCTQQMTVADQPCSGGQVCGWNASKGYYDCVPAPGGADSSGTNPMACGGTTSTSSSSSSSSSTSSSSSSSSTSSGTMGGVTWTQLYNTVFGPSGSSSCVKNGGCHTFSQSGFKCGTSASACYNGLVSSGWVTPGSGASASPFADPNQSPLCGSLGGNMPQGGSCISSSALTNLKSWLASGAPNN